MPQFRFNTISREDIERSQGGNIMLNAIDYDGNDHQVITGVPGSGKTTVTIMRAERLLNAKKRILIFTYQKLLTISLKNIASSDELKNKIETFHKWYSSMTNGRWASNDDENEMITRLNHLSTFDEILIDEGQDFEESIFRALLTRCKIMTVGADKAQMVHEDGMEPDEIIKLLESDKAYVPVPLQYNYRNTFEIYNFARFFIPDNERAANPFTLNMMPRGNGNLPVVIQVLSEEEKINRLKIILEDAGDRNIAILLYHKDEVDTLHQQITDMGLSATRFHSGNQPAEIENILITTYKAAKGLEFQVVIMPDMHTAMNEDYKTAEHYYIGCTRARESLYLTYTGNILPAFFNEFNKDSYELRLTETGNKSANQPAILDDLPF